MEVMDDGKFTFVRDVHFSNALLPILVSDDGKNTLASAEQLLKA